MDTEISAYMITEEPYYAAQGNEIEIFEAAYKNGIPLLLKGPTGCGKSRFMEYMAWRLQRPLITVSCHDDLTSSDLVGRYLIVGGETRWTDGPLTRAVRCGGICYLDEVVEARKDTTVVIHPLADDRRVLPIEKTGELVQAGEEFCLAISYNPGYQSVLKDLKQSTRQRFVAMEFDYPDAKQEQEIIELVNTVEGANEAHRLRTRRIGHSIGIEVHVRIQSDLNIKQGHDIATNIENVLKDRFGHGTFVSVHIEPLGE
jgi:nitric oxide reductase NorQ protein